MKKGFTLIELMVVISIIALFSSMGMFSYASARVKANDAKKKVETNQVEKAILLYKDAKGVVPANHTGNNSVAVEGTQAFTDSMQELVTSGYLPSIPKSTDNTYVYYADASSTSATFGARLKGDAPAPVGKSSCTAIVPPVTYSRCWPTTSVPVGTQNVVNFTYSQTVDFCKLHGSPLSCFPGADGSFTFLCGILFGSNLNGWYGGVGFDYNKSQQASVVGGANQVLALGGVTLPGGGGTLPGGGGATTTACSYVSSNPTISCVPVSGTATSTCAGVNNDYCACIQ